MAGMNGTRVSVVVFATSFLLGTPYDAPALAYRPHACSQSRAIVHALDSGLVNSMEAAGYRRAVKDGRDVLFCYRQNSDRFPLLFRLRGRRWRPDDTLVPP